MIFFRKTIFFAVLFCSSILSLSQSPAYGQQHKRLTWSLVTIDSTWTPQGNTITGEIIAKYKPTIDPLTLPIGISVKELNKQIPESPLSNLTTDIIFKYGQQYLDTHHNGKTIDMAITNFGGIRTSLPAGEVTSFDILSIFPFDNRIVIVELPGKYLRELMENFAKRSRIEAMSGVEIEIIKNQLTKCKIGGKEINDAANYHVATIDFLLSGGDSVYALKYASNVIETGTILRDAVIAYVKNETANGRKIDANNEGRVVITEGK